MKTRSIDRKPWRAYFFINTNGDACMVFALQDAIASAEMRRLAHQTTEVIQNLLEGAMKS